MSRWAAWTLLFLLSLPAVFAAKPPEWVVPHLDAVSPKTPRGAVQLHDFEEVRYLTEERVRRTVRGAVRVISASGRTYASCDYGLNPDLEKIVSAQAWVIDPSGKKAQAFSTSDFSDMPSQFGRHFWMQHRRISFSASDRVEIGGTIAWEFQIESLVGLWDVSWTFDAPLPVLESVFEVTPPAGGRLDWHGSNPRVPQPVAGKAPGALRWAMLSIIPDLGDRPDGFQSHRLRVSVRAVGGQGKSALGTWPEFARFAAGIMEQQRIMTDEVKARAAALVAGKEGRWERIRAIGEFLQRDVSYLSVSLGKDYIAGYRPHPPADVLKNRFGDCKDKVTLMLAMLQSIGEKAYPVLVSSGSPLMVNEKWPGAVFNHVIVGLPVDEQVPAHWPVGEAPGTGKLVMFDPTDRFTPLGFLSGSDQGGFGLVAQASCEGLVEMPTATPEVNRHTSTITATLDANGDMRVATEERVRGVRGVARHARREQQSVDEAKKALEVRLREGGLIAQAVQSTETWSADTGEHRLNYEFLAQRYARKVGGMIMVAPQVLTLQDRLSPWKTEREGVAWLRAGAWDKSVTLKLPEGMKVVEMPDNFSADGPQGSARITYKAEGDAVVVHFVLKHRGGLLEREDYEVLRTMLANFAEAERQPILLRGNAASVPVKKS